MCGCNFLTVISEPEHWHSQATCFRRENLGPNQLNFTGFVKFLVHIAALKYLSDLPLGTNMPLSACLDKLIRLHFDLYVFPDISKKVTCLLNTLHLQAVGIDAADTTPGSRLG